MAGDDWRMPPVYSYKEASADESPANASFTPRSQTASAPYYTEPTAFADMPNRLIDVLGYTGTKSLEGDNAGKINRVLPLRHPQYQWLFADGFRPRGKGANSTTVTPSPGPGSSIIPQFPLYNVYTCDISFSQRDYNSWQDKDIKVYSRTGSSGGYKKDGTAYDYSFATEWLRFTTFEMLPLNNFINAQQGMMRFRAFGGGGSWAPASGPDGIQYQDSPRMYLPDSALKVKWFQVPYRYLTSPKSYLRKFIGHINQNDWGDVQTSATPAFGPYKAGSLLYHGARPTAIYSNVVPDEGLLAFNMTNGFSRSRLCDLELDFTYTARTFDAYAVANGYVPDFSGVNKNWIVAGHNLLPWMRTRSFVYASTFDTNSPSTQASWYPSFNSFPFELLFMDPDATNAPTLDP